MRYKNRYGNKQKQDAYMNACDCLLYGYGRSYWNACGIEEHEQDEVWRAAIRDLYRLQEEQE